MPYNEILADRIREMLVDVPRVQEKKMFRGVTFMVNKKMCVSVSLDRLMCRIDPVIHDSLVENDGCRTVNMRGHDLKGWIYVDEDVVRSERALKYWLNLALDFNGRIKASAKKKKKNISATQKGSTAKKTVRKDSQKPAKKINRKT